MARNFSGYRRMTKSWANIGSGSSLLVTSDVTLIQNSLAFTGPFTVMRMVGEYCFSPDNSVGAVAGDQAQVTVGICVANTDAVAAGAGGMPDPQGEAELGWLYWKQHSYFVGTVLTNPHIAIRESFDIRSMRKMKARESLVFLVVASDFALSPGIRFMSSKTRVLLGNP